jgi:hypothetical protein
MRSSCPRRKTWLCGSPRSATTTHPPAAYTMSRPFGWNSRHLPAARRARRRRQQRQQRAGAGRGGGGAAAARAGRGRGGAGLHPRSCPEKPIACSSSIEGSPFPAAPAQIARGEGAECVRARAGGSVPRADPHNDGRRRRAAWPTAAPRGWKLAARGGRGAAVGGRDRISTRLARTHCGERTTVAVGVNGDARIHALAGALTSVFRTAPQKCTAIKSGHAAQLTEAAHIAGQDRS